MVLYVVDYAGVTQNSGTGGKVIGLINPHAEADTVTIYDGKALSTPFWLSHSSALYGILIHPPYAPPHLSLFRYMLLRVFVLRSY